MLHRLCQHSVNQPRYKATRSISVQRVSIKIGTVSPALMLAIDDALRLHLAL